MLEKFKLKLKESELTKRESELSEGWKKLENEKEKVRKREKDAHDAEIRREEGYTDEREKLDKEIFDKRKELEDELNERRTNVMVEISEQTKVEGMKRHIQLDKELEEKRNEVVNGIKENKNTENDLIKKTGDLNSREYIIKIQEEEIERKTNALDEEADRRSKERIDSSESDKTGLYDEIERLRDDLSTTKKAMYLYEDLERKLGGEPPEKVMLELRAKEERINQLNRELLERPTKEMVDIVDSLNREIDALKNTKTRLSEENKELKETVHISNRNEFNEQEWKEKESRWESRNYNLDADVSQLKEEIKRLRSRYERTEDREARVKDIETPYFKEFMERAKLEPVEGKDISEIEWLDGVIAKCTAYGLKFPKRIVYAYHTALKTAEWSPLTVLAGVSGTGKSELPRLYAHFGGLKFLSVSVQPNWDSQESMLGFFNSIDNRFDAHPVLNLLSQTQKKSEGEPGDDNYYHGLEDVMTIILLDEMNLAHIELYFAEFLSKFESRRGRPEKHTEYIEVKLGSGLESYKLSLGRNVLWSGTMNQDETTKSLSDKVLDRGIIINFPRPTVLERREKLNPLGEKEFEPAPLLPRDVWRGWRTMESLFSVEQIKPFKGFVEDMNKSLSKVSRALGHRVWQSVEYYMANYPTVINALKSNDEERLKEQMHIAFEDQLVQKIMPKLRGIETQSKAGKSCLDEINSQLEKEGYNIVNDFNLARESGYGQFIWNSATYIEEDKITTPSESKD